MPQKSSFIDPEEEHLIELAEKPTQGSGFRRDFWKALPWIVCSVLVLTNFVSIWLALQPNNTDAKYGTFKAGFQTDFDDAKAHIKMEQRRFHSSLAFDADGKGYFVDPDPIRYWGNPAEYPEVNENWRALVHGRYFFLSAVEALDSFGNDMAKYWAEDYGGYIAGLDMFHTLHCLASLPQLIVMLRLTASFEQNHIRQIANRAIYVAEEDDLYPIEQEDIIHSEHCVEHLRQYIMCSGDLTPVPTLNWASLNRSYVQTNVVHTCRNYESLHTWLLGRYMEHGGAPASQPAVP